MTPIRQIVSRIFSSMPTRGAVLCRAALGVVAVFTAFLCDRPAAAGGGTAQIVRIQGPVGPATDDYLEEAFATAHERGAAVIVLTIDTPGGLSQSMRAIIRRILGAPVPVVGYVYPSGARAASAGTYILYACHVAAMAPGTNLGAATPIQIGGGGLPLPGKKKTPPEEAQPDRQSDQAPPEDAMTAKMVNDAVAYIRSLARLRGRNADWAEQSVRHGASLPVREALDRGVIDLVAHDVADLLKKTDGRTVAVGDRELTLRTAGLSVEIIEPGWRSRLLAILTNPNVAFVLILLGVYGLFFEFANPGSIGPGVLGAICLLLGFYALNVLPLNYAGLGLLLLAIALMVAEAFVPAFGVLGIGGIVAFVLAAVMLFDSDIPGFRISWPVIIVTAAFSGAFLIFVLGYVWRAQRRPVTTGNRAWIGKEVEVLEWSGKRGVVRCGGERWHAEADDRLAPHDRVTIRGSDGLVLQVEKKRS